MRRKPLFPPPHNAKTGKRAANKGRQRRHVVTINGRIRLLRRWWYLAESGSAAPADDLLDSQGATITAGVLEMACRENMGTSGFRRAAENLARLGQVVLSPEHLRLAVEAAGRQVLQAQQKGAIRPAWTAKDCHVAGEQNRTVTRVYTGCDGVMVPIITEAEKHKRREKIKAQRRRCGKKRKPLAPRKRGANLPWKEFKVVYFYSQDMRRQHVAFTHRSREATGQLMRREADRLQFREAQQRIAIVDGASWLREQMELHLAELDGLGLDFYHLSENVHRARHAVFGQDSHEGKVWADALMHVFKHQGYGRAWERLVAWRAQLGRSRKSKAADRLLSYVAERREMVRYPEFQRRGWQIGSGPTESQCRLCTDRLKGHGRRWDRPNAEAVAALDTLHRSGQWRQFWPNASPVPT